MSASEDELYYAIAIERTISGGSLASTLSKWGGTFGDRKHFETREGRPHDLEITRQVWLDAGVTPSVIDDAESLKSLVKTGGAGVIAAAVAENCIPKAVEPAMCVRVGDNLHSYVALDSLPPSFFERHPTASERMGVLARDKFACQACGRTRADSLDLKLHVHHIQPWAEGGLTYDENLVTLCETCHDGLDTETTEAVAHLIRTQRELAVRAPSPLPIHRRRQAKKRVHPRELPVPGRGSGTPRWWLAFNLMHRIIK